MRCGTGKVITDSVHSIIFSGTRLLIFLVLVVASAADNASSNGPMNRAVVRYCAQRNPNVGTARNMQIGCGGHVTNLVAQ